MLRKKETDAAFQRALQNPLNPINNTEPSDEMKEYLKDLNAGKLHRKSERSEKAKEELEKKEKEKGDLFCPTCRRPTLKRGRHMFHCGYCGLETKIPLRSV